MKNLDYLSLDGNNIKVFLTVLEELSVTKAAIRLDATQSSISHTLDKLRAVLDDPLFVRSGRNIAPTERALGLQEPMQEVLDRLKMLNDSRQFDPREEELVFKIAANDFQRSLIFPRITQHFYEQSINVRLHFMPAQIPDAKMLRKGNCDLVITPFPPSAGDIFQIRLFSDYLMCYFDDNKRQAPSSKRELLHSKFIDVVFDNHRSVMQALFNSIDMNVFPKPIITVPNFDAMSEFILNTDLITVQMERMAQTSLKELSCSPLPFKTKKLNIYMVWHRRFKNDPAHIWLRQRILDAC